MTQIPAKKTYKWRSIILHWSPYVNHLYFVPTCSSPKSPGSWLHFLHWMMIFCALAKPSHRLFMDTMKPLAKSNWLENFLTALLRLVEAETSTSRVSTHVGGIFCSRSFQSFLLLPKSFLLLQWRTPEAAQRFPKRIFCSGALPN